MSTVALEAAAAAPLREGTAAEDAAAAAPLHLAAPAAVVFDCDGVLLDSNALKNACFREAVFAAGYGDQAADAFAAVQSRHFGVSRYRIFDKLFTDVLQRPVDAPACEALVQAYAALCEQRYPLAPATDGSEALVAWLAARVPVYVASGTDQEELRRLFAARGWAPSFAGIFGSPTPKSALLWAIRDALPQVPPQRILMVGDALADHDAALAAGTSFVFVSRWAAQPGDIRERAATTGVPVARDLHHLHGALRATFGESAP